ncbi:hypothetical protein [Nonomuraea sp. NPDC005650]|uniref:hypothetical protein n=1 Tax=Nonomuraea sp. NPDC005650 TaxID=3157045 RepID=UPI00339E657B
MTSIDETSQTAAAEEEIVGYVVVATSSQPETARWMSPGRYADLDLAEGEREYWGAVRHLEDAGLRLAKLVLLPDPPTS